MICIPLMMTSGYELLSAVIALEISLSDLSVENRITAPDYSNILLILVESVELIG